MNLPVTNDDENITKIEDVLDIQKASGSFSLRQVVFDLPSEPDEKVPATIARSLESGLTKTNPDASDKKKLKKVRSRRSPVPDVISWPSDSDITVLRMKLFRSRDIKDKFGNIPGDGLHQPDDSSMVNLATLVQTETCSKHSIEECLLPLSSWEGQDSESKNEITEVTSSLHCALMNHELGILNAICRRPKEEKFAYNDSEVPPTSAKSKFARFLRLYFCPCCSCLYNIENNIKLDQGPSVNSTQCEELLA